MFDIDLVVPYVDNTDKVWIKGFKDFCKSHAEYKGHLQTINGERYRDRDNLFSLNLRLIRACLPFVRNIYLIVSNIEQIKGLNTKGINVVLHEDIMPKEILPTFNSSVIEMFVGNIKGLAEHFIYINDDMFPVRKMKPTDFFTEDGKGVKMDIYPLHITTESNLFRKMVIRIYRDVFKDTDDYLGDDFYLRPEHSASPLLLSVVQDTYKKYEAQIRAHCEPFRNPQQFNQYLFMYEQIKRDLVEPSPLKFIYLKMKNDNFLRVLYDIANKNGSNLDWICFNDNEEDEMLQDYNTRCRLIKESLEICLARLEGNK